MEEAQQHGLQEYFNWSNELEQQQPNEDPIDYNSHSPFSKEAYESCENYPDYEQTLTVNSENPHVKLNEQVQSRKLTRTTKAINKKVNEEYSNNSQRLACSSLGTNSSLQDSDAVSLSAAEAKYIGLIGKELLLGALNRRFPIPNNCDKVNANQPVPMLHQKSNSTSNDFDDVELSQQQRSNSPIHVSANIHNISNYANKVDEPMNNFSSLTNMPNSGIDIATNDFDHFEKASEIPCRFSDNLVTSLSRSKEKPGIHMSILPNEISHILPARWKKIPVIEKPYGYQTNRSFGPEYCNFFAEILSQYNKHCVFAFTRNYIKAINS